MTDPIVEEVRRVRDAHAARFGYDLEAIFRDIKEPEQRSGHVFVSGAARRDSVVTEFCAPPAIAAPVR